MRLLASWVIAASAAGLLSKVTYRHPVDAPVLRCFLTRPPLAVGQCPPSAGAAPSGHLPRHPEWIETILVLRSRPSRRLKELDGGTVLIMGEEGASCLINVK